MEHLSKKTQILILNDVKKLLTESPSMFNYLDNNGLCHYLKIAYNEHKIEGVGIDGFSVENATVLAYKYKFPKPNGVILWWNFPNQWNEIRIQFIDALISELNTVKEAEIKKVSIVKHNLDVYYNPMYNGLHVVHSDNGKTVTIGSCCNFYNDAYTSIIRHEVDKSYLKRLIKLDKEKLFDYDFLELHELFFGYFSLCVCDESFIRIKQ